MGASIDFSELNRFYTEMNITEQQYNDFLSDFLIETGETIIGRAKEDTPVDTGALKASWGLATEKTLPYEMQMYSPYFGRDVAKMMYKRLGAVETEGFGTSMSITLSNPQEYASQIEDGYDMGNGNWYEGKHMLKTAIERTTVDMPSMYEVKFNKFKREMMLE